MTDKGMKMKQKSFWGVEVC